MATQYLLSCCKCDATIAVAPSQAGDRITCDCGHVTEAPTLRRLRELPAQEVEQTAEPTWGLRQGVLAAGLLGVLALSGAAAWLILTQPAPPEPFDAVMRQEVVTAGIDQITPAQSWAMWKSAYQPLANRGFQLLQNPEELYALRQIEANEAIRSRLIKIAGGLLVVTLAAYALLPRS